MQSQRGAQPGAFSPGGAHVRFSSGGAHVRFSSGGAHVRFSPGSAHVRISPGSAPARISPGSTNPSIPPNTQVPQQTTHALSDGMQAQPHGAVRRNLINAITGGDIGVGSEHHNA
jgi:hypothetical protein